MLQGEVAMFCLPGRGAREEEERKRREKGCEDQWLVFPSWSEPASLFIPSDRHWLLDTFFTDLIWLSQQTSAGLRATAKFCDIILDICLSEASLVETF